MLARSSHPRTSPARAAFSLVELLVVIAIMAILAGLSFALLGQTGQAARESATRGGIQVIQSALDDRMRGFDNLTQNLSLADPDLPLKFELKAFRKQSQAFMTLYNSATPTPPYPIEQADAEIYIRKALFKSAFPQREEDLWGWDGVSDFDPTGSVPPSGGSVVDDSPLLTRMWDTATSDWDLDSWKGRDKSARIAAPLAIVDDDLAESAELLYLILTEGDVYGLSPADLDGLDQNLIGDTDNDDNLELLDGWGRPLQFYNWPTRLFKANGTTFVAADYTQASILVTGLPLLSAPAAERAIMNRDPADNASRLTRLRDLQGIPRRFNADFNLFGLTLPARALGPDWFHDRDCYSVSLIVSAGPDGLPGMSLPNASTTATEHHLGRVTNAEELADNLSNRQKGPQ